MSRKNPIKLSKPITPFYADFRNMIKTILKINFKGMTLAELKKSVDFAPELPLNNWMQKLERDIGLRIVQEGQKLLWKIENDTIFDIGYEGKTAESFTQKLKENHIDVVIDVREVPVSRKKKFSKGILARTIENAGIQYKHVLSLATPKSMLEKIVEIKKIEDLAKENRVAIMCFEKDHDKCHRSVLSDILEKRGWNVKHLG